MDQALLRIIVIIITSAGTIGVIMALLFQYNQNKFAKVKSWVETNSASWELLKKLAYDTVIAAQQMFDSNGEKKAYVLKYLADKTGMDETDLLNALEGAVKEAKKDFGDLWDKVPTATPPAA